jgi:hypothetical protein
MAHLGAMLHGTHNSSLAFGYSTVWIQCSKPNVTNK